MKPQTLAIAFASMLIWAGCGYVAYGVSRAGSCTDLKIEVVQWPAYYLDNPANLQQAWRWRDRLGRVAAALGPFGLLFSAADIGDGFLLGDCNCKDELNTAYGIQEGKKEPQNVSKH